MSKSQLRKIYLARQKSFLPSERMQKSEQIVNRFFRELSLKDIRFLHCFISIEKYNEIDTSLIFKRLWQDFPQIQTLVPKVNFKTDEIDNLELTIETKPIKNAWQIPEPATGETFKTNKIDMVLVPLLCFDKTGFRIGYGKGFYDRFLKRSRNDCLKIGLSYFEPVEKISDVENFDVKLDFCVTPDKVWRF